MRANLRASVQRCPGKARGDGAMPPAWARAPEIYETGVEQALPVSVPVPVHDSGMRAPAAQQRRSRTGTGTPTTEQSQRSVERRSSVQVATSHDARNADSERCEARQVRGCCEKAEIVPDAEPASHAGTASSMSSHGDAVVAAPDIVARALAGLADRDVPLCARSQAIPAGRRRRRPPHPSSSRVTRS